MTGCKGCIVIYTTGSTRGYAYLTPFGVRQPYNEELRTLRIPCAPCGQELLKHYVVTVQPNICLKR